MPETPEEWRDHLLKQLDDRQKVIAQLHAYYDGDHALPELPQKSSNDIKRLRDNCTLNLCPLVVDSVVERLSVQGFQFGDSDGLDVWRNVWQANRLDADSDLVHTEALTARRAFVLVWPENGEVTITPESPEEVLVAYSDGSRRTRTAAVKRFCTGTGRSKVTDVTVWLPGKVYRWTKEGTARGGWGEGTEGDAPAALGQQIPMVEFLANPDLRGNPHSELDRGVIDIQNRINKTVFDRLVLTEFQAFPQRWGIGLEVEQDSDGNAIQPFEVGPNKIAINESSEVRFGQWDAADLKPLLDAVQADIHALAAQTKTPVYYLAQSFSNVSADAIRAAEAGLVKKVERHQRIFGEAWEEVLRLALLLAGDARANDQASSIEWANAETRTAAEEADAAVKLRGVIPNTEIQRRLGYSQQERDRFASDLALEGLDDAAAVA